MKSGKVFKDSDLAHFVEETTELKNFMVLIHLYRYQKILFWFDFRTQIIHVCKLKLHDPRLLLVKDETNSRMLRRKNRIDD